MAGLKKSIVDNMITYFKCENAEKYLCVDNDTAGWNFISSIKNEYPDVKILLPDERTKNWNGKLADIKVEGTLSIEDGKNEMKLEELKRDNKLVENGHRGEFVTSKKPVKSGNRIL